MTVSSPQAISAPPQKQKEIDTITKVNFVLTNHLMEALNASPSYTYESTWGYRQKDGMWSGMLGELVEQRADIGGSPLFFTEDRVSVVEYIAMPTPTRSKFVFRQPKLSYTNNVFALPFRGDVWACSAVLAIVLAVLLGATATWETKIKKDTSHSSWGDAMVMTIGAVCQQGTYVQLKGGVGRALTLSLFLSLMFLYTSYSANIVALLQSSSSRIKTLSDLLNSRLKLAVHDTVFNRYYFSTATEPVRKAIYQKKIAPPGQKPRFITLEEGVRNIKQGLFAFHMEIGVGYKVVGEIFREDEKCGLQEIQYLQVVDPYLAVQKNSSYKEMFKIGMARIQEYGLQSRQNWMLYTHRPSCTRGGSFVSVGLLDVRPALTLLVWGLIAGAVGLILEILLAKRSKIKEALMCRKKFNRKRRS